MPMGRQRQEAFIDALADLLATLLLADADPSGHPSPAGGDPPESA
jgi:hypothetical protein